jgi:hypothetical protein
LQRARKRFVVLQGLEGEVVALGVDEDEDEPKVNT